jgi:RNA polymerase sigma-70 factor (ECF subfamily)
VDSQFKDRRFRTTRWSVVMAARSKDDAEARAALSTLCQAYWYPLYAFARRKGTPPEDASDLVQEFFAGLLERADVARADPARGRFRAWLLAAFKHHLSNEWDRARAQKRGGGRVIVSLDDDAETRYLQEPAHDVTPERLYERRWTLTLIDRVFDRLRTSQEAAGKSAFFAKVRPFLLGDADGPLHALAAELGMTEGALKTATCRLRKACAEMLKEEIAETVEDPADVEDELRHLWESLH